MPTAASRREAAAIAAPSGAQIEIEFEDQRATVVEVGGGLRTYSVGGRELIDGYEAGELCPSGRGQLLMPWPNRLEDGRYDFEGGHQLAINEIETSTAIHGLVRWLPWAVSERTDARVALQCTLHAQPGYPFSLALSIEYTLSSDGLAVRTTATNMGERRCPFGSGAHPYLTLGRRPVDSLLFSLPASSVLRSDSRGLPVAQEPVDGTAYDFRQPRLLGDVRLDHAFHELGRGDDGRVAARLIDPADGRGVMLWTDETFGWVMLFTGDDLPDVSRRSIAVEPMTCPPNAFRSGEGVSVLEPGGSCRGEWGLSPIG